MSENMHGVEFDMLMGCKRGLWYYFDISMYKVKYVRFVDLKHEKPTYDPFAVTATQYSHVCLKHACTPGSSPSRVTPPTFPSFWVTWFIAPATRTLPLAAVTIITRGARAVALCTVPAGLAGITGTISSRADLVIFTETTAKDRKEKESERELAVTHRYLNQQVYPRLHLPHFTTTAILSSFTGLVAEGSLVPCVAQALPVGRVTAAVCKVTVTSPVTAGSPPACLTIAHTGALITRRQVAVATDRTFQPPVAPMALAPAR